MSFTHIVVQTLLRLVHVSANICRLQRVRVRSLKPTAMDEIVSVKFMFAKCRDFVVKTGGAYSNH